MSQTVAVVTDIASELANVAEQIEGLNKQSEQITSIVQVIRSIADQTNLLALNPSNTIASVSSNSSAGS